MSSLLDELPRWREHRARVADARTRHNAVRSQALAARRQFAEDVAAHEQRVAAAVANGSPVPTDAPTLPAAFDLAHLLVQSEEAALVEESRLLRAELAVAVEELAARRWQQRRQDIAEAVRVVEQAAAETSAEAAEVAHLRGLADVVNGHAERPSRADRTRVMYDVAAIVEVVQQQADPFELEPLPPPQIQIDSERNATARGGSVDVQRDPRSSLLDPQRRL